MSALYSQFNDHHDDDNDDELQSHTRHHKETAQVRGCKYGQDMAKVEC
jgi:hypothetical protein